MKALLVLALLPAAASAQVMEICAPSLLKAPSEDWAEAVNETLNSKDGFTAAELTLMKEAGLKPGLDPESSLVAFMVAREGSAAGPLALVKGMQKVCAARKMASAVDESEQRESLSADLRNARARLDKDGTVPSSSLMQNLRERFNALHPTEKDAERAAADRKTYDALAAAWVARARLIKTPQPLIGLLRADAKAEGRLADFDAHVEKAEQAEEVRRKLEAQRVPARGAGQAGGQLQREAGEQAAQAAQPALSPTCKAECDAYHAKCDEKLSGLEKCNQKGKGGCDPLVNAVRICQNHLMMLRDEQSCVCN